MTPKIDPGCHQPSIYISIDGPRRDVACQPLPPWCVGIPLRVVRPHFPLVDVRSIPVPGRRSRSFTVDLDDYMVVGLDIEFVDAWVDEVNRSWCLGRPLGLPGDDPSPPEPPGDSDPDEVSSPAGDIEPLPLSSATTSSTGRSSILHQLEMDRAAVEDDRDSPGIAA